MAIEEFRREMAEAGVAEAVDAIVASYVDSSAGRISSLSAAAAAGDTAEVARLAHSFKSASAQLGARRLAEVLAELEQAGRASDVATMKRKSAEFGAEAARVMEYLKTGK